MEKYICRICHYIYDPEIGDPDENISPGTSFNDLPENWKCPVCRAPKEDFLELDEYELSVKLLSEYTESTDEIIEV